MKRSDIVIIGITLLVTALLASQAIAQVIIHPAGDGSFAYTWGLEDEGPNPKFDVDSTHTNNIQFFDEGSRSFLIIGSRAVDGTVEWHFQAEPGSAFRDDVVVNYPGTCFFLNLSQRVEGSFIRSEWSTNGVDYVEFYFSDLDTENNCRGAPPDALRDTGFPGGADLYIRYTLRRELSSLRAVQLFRSGPGSIDFVVTGTLGPPCFAIDAIDDQFSLINDGATADIFVLENEECSDDAPISVVELPGDLLPDRGGSATTDGAMVSYTPAAGFAGFEEFTYTAQDAGLAGGDDPPAVDQDTATVVVDVLENFIPDAVDDVATTSQDQATIIDVLANDTPGNAPNVVTIETEPANGSVTLQADDTIQYSPKSDFFGEDSFTYRLTDTNGDSDVATVTVGVFFVSGQVPIDIMPKSDGNDLNLRAGQGAGINIAILSVGEFFEAPNEIDPLTLKFGPREANIWGSPQVRDVDADGDDDFVVKFLIQQTGIPCGDTHAILFGRTFDFQSISGRDTINTFNCPRIRKRH